MHVAIANRHKQQEGWSSKEVSEGFYRRIVPSPIPQEIFELDTIRQSSGN